MGGILLIGFCVVFEISYNHELYVFCLCNELICCCASWLPCGLLLALLSLLLMFACLKVCMFLKKQIN